mmetsp:Transcript_37371/g.63609  ORF Transcript_37371/g.63609 Transcript_37371/m.63609 type:complete len:90 (-) Transcript_37371:2056-2325(-)
MTDHGSYVPIDNTVLVVELMRQLISAASMESSSLVLASVLPHLGDCLEAWVAVAVRAAGAALNERRNRAPASGLCQTLIFLLGCKNRKE